MDKSSDLENRIDASSPIGEYVGSFFAVAGAIFVRWVASPWLGDTTPFITVFAVLLILVAVSACSSSSPTSPSTSSAPFSQTDLVVGTGTQVAASSASVSTTACSSPSPEARPWRIV